MDIIVAAIIGSVGIMAIIVASILIGLIITVLMMEYHDYDD